MQTVIKWYIRPGEEYVETGNAGGIRFYVFERDNLFSLAVKPERCTRPYKHIPFAKSLYASREIAKEAAQNYVDRIFADEHDTDTGIDDIRPCFISVEHLDLLQEGDEYLTCTGNWETITKESGLIGRPVVIYDRADPVVYLIRGLNAYYEVRRKIGYFSLKTNKFTPLTSL